MERSKACLCAFFDDAPNTLPSLFSGNCKRRNPASGEPPFKNAEFGQIPTGRFLYHLIQQSKGLQLTVKVSLLIQQVMATNDVSDDVVQYGNVYKYSLCTSSLLAGPVSSATKEAGVTPEEYRVTLRAHCKDHWDWSPIVNFAHEFFSHLGSAMYSPSGLRAVPVESGGETPNFQSLEEIKVTLERFGTPGHYGQKEMIKLVRERDGKKCLLTHLLFSTRTPVVDRVTTDPKLAYIYPAKLANHENPLVHQAFAAFWNDEELTKRFATQVNGPANCLLLPHDAHKNLEEMCWAIEAIENVDRDAWDYYFVKLGGQIFPYGPADGTRMKFGAEGGRFKNNIPLPSPDLCNLRLAVTRVMRLSGAAEVVESWKGDYDDG